MSRERTPEIDGRQNSRRIRSTKGGEKRHLAQVIYCLVCVQPKFVWKAQGCLSKTQPSPTSKVYSPILKRCCWNFIFPVGASLILQACTHGRSSIFFMSIRCFILPTILSIFSFVTYLLFLIWFTPLSAAGRLWMPSSIKMGVFFFLVEYSLGLWPQRRFDLITPLNRMSSKEHHYININ